MRLTYLTLLTLLCSTLNGQNYLVGKVQTVVQNEAISLPRVHLSYSLNTSTSVTNLSGMFSLNKALPNDTLIVSRVGYKIQRLPLSIFQNLNDTLIVQLEPSPLVLPQIRNLNEQGERIVNQMIRRLDSNYHEYLSKLEGIYRHQVIEDSIYSFFAQCNVDLYPTTQRLTTPLKERTDLDLYLKVMLRQAQMSEDGRDPRINSPVALFDLFYNGVFQNDPLLDFPHMFNFRLGKLIHWNGKQLYQIWFEVKEKFREQLQAKGYLYIDHQSFAIVHKRIEMSQKPYEIKSRTPINTPFSAVFSPYSIVVYTDYEQIGDIWRPKFIQRERKLNIYSEQYPAINHKYFFVDDFYTFKQKSLKLMPTEFAGDTLNIHQDIRPQLSLFHKNRLGQRDLKNFHWFILPDFELDRYTINY